MVPFINQVLHAISRGHAMGTAVMHRSLRNLDVRVRGTSWALDVQEKTSLETCAARPVHTSDTSSPTGTNCRRHACTRTGELVVTLQLYIGFQFLNYQF